MPAQKDMATGQRPVTSGVSRTAIASALTALAWTASSVIVVLLPHWGPQVSNAHGSYADGVTWLLALILSVVALTGLQRRQEGRAGRLGQVGYWLIVVPFVVAAVWDLAQLIVGSRIAVPVFPIYVFASRLGFIFWAIAAYRARVLPRWLGPAFALAWVLAPPFGPLAAFFAIPVPWALATLGVWRPTTSAK